jgi:FAD/FMN-containing dehydrogenase
MSLDRGLVAELKAIVGRAHVRTEPGDVEPFPRDATPDLPAVPGCRGLAVHRRGDRGGAAAGHQRGVPVVSRGAGSNLCAAAVAERGGIVLVLTRMDRILEVSRDEMQARVEAGVTAAAKGLRPTPDPGAAPCRRSAEMWPPVPAACVGSNTGSPATTCSASAGDHLLDPRPDRAGRDAAGWASGKRRGPARRCRAPTLVQLVNSYLNEMANRIR